MRVCEIGMPRSAAKSEPQLYASSTISTCFKAGRSMVGVLVNDKRIVRDICSHL